MMDIVTKSHFEQFKKHYDYADKAIEEVFELFVIYSVVSNYLKSDTINKSTLESLHIGNGGDWGIDGIIVFVNGKIVTTVQEVKDLCELNSFINAHIILVQAKTSKSITVSELGQTLDGSEYLLKDILEEEKLPICNESLQEYRDLLKYIYSRSADFIRGENPVMDVYYVTCGEYNQQADHIAKINKSKTWILSTNLISNYECHVLGKKELISLYKATMSKVEADLKIEHKMALPEIKDVEEAYLCLIPFTEFKKLIVDSNGVMISSVFYDNIRDYQGDNTVNKAMAESINKGDIDLFVAMNNGITIVAADLKITGTKVHISDYQIVNGCQTSNVLYRHSSVDGINNLTLTVKLVASKDKTVKDKIIVGNNSQTEVKREQLVALLDTQKEIEDYYNAQKRFEKLYYERRSKQYKSDNNIPVNRVITIPFQIKAFVSMMMGCPHEVGGYYGRIVERFDTNGEKVFASNTNPALYYTSALACYKMTEAFSMNRINRKYKKIKFHVLLAFRLMCEKTPIPNFSSHKIQEYCDHICEILSDNYKCKLGFEAAIKMIDEVLGREPKDRDRMDQAFTNCLMEAARKISQKREKSADAHI